MCAFSVICITCSQQMKTVSYIAVFLGFAKAYDRVDWTYMCRVLSRMGFGHPFCSWIKMLYHISSAHLLINGNLLALVGVTRGIKQGDPLSVFLFLLFIERWENLLRSHPDLGIPITRVMRSTSLFFADDSKCRVLTLNRARSPYILLIYEASTHRNMLIFLAFTFVNAIPRPGTSWRSKNDLSTA